MRRLYLFRWVRLHGWRFLRHVSRQRATPHAIALGTAIGVFIGLTPTVGLQTLIVLFLATLVGASRVAAVLPVWITNPVTLVPVYTFNYWLGTLLVGGVRVEVFRETISGILADLQAGEFGRAWGELFTLGIDVSLPLWLGSVLVGLVAAAPTYPLMRRAVILVRARLHRKRADRHARVLDLLRKRFERGGEENGHAQEGTLARLLHLHRHTPQETHGPSAEDSPGRKDEASAPDAKKD